MFIIPSSEERPEEGRDGVLTYCKLSRKGNVDGVLNSPLHHVPFCTVLGGYI